MSKMSGFFGNLARTFSDEVKAYTSGHPHARSPLGATPGLNERNQPGINDTASTGPDAYPVADASARVSSAPINMPSVARSDHSIGSSVSSCQDVSPPGTPVADGSKRKAYKIHGMDAYDYWSLIRSL